MIDLVGHVAYVFIGLGMWLLGKRNPLGFLSQAVGAAIWMVCGYFLGLSSVVIWNLLFLAIGINGYYNLRRENEVQKTP